MENLNNHELTLWKTREAALVKASAAMSQWILNTLYLQGQRHVCILLSASSSRQPYTPTQQLLAWVLKRKWATNLPRCLAVPVLHERVDPDHGRAEEDRRHAHVEARQRDFCC